MQRAQFRSTSRFQREALPGASAPQGMLLETPQFRVHCAPLEHHDITSLAFVFEESVHINVWKSRLDELRLPTGPWLTELKKQVHAGAPDCTRIKVRWRTRNGPQVREMELGELKQSVLEFVPGQKICYVTDVADNERNRSALGAFLQGR